MVNIKTLACLAVLGLLSLSELSATNYYVAKTGDDNNPGTREAPFLTLLKASTMLFAGDTCFVMEGVYREKLALPRSGTPQKPIVYKAFGNDSVLMSATEPLEGWVHHSGHVYKVHASMGLGRQNMLYFNGKAMEWARWPNNTDGDKYTIQASPIEGGSASTLTDTDIPDLPWTGGYMWYLGAHSGTSWTRPISGYNPSTHTLSFQAVDVNKWPLSSHNPTEYRNGNRGGIVLFGILSALDHPGEWYYDDAMDTLYFQAPGNADPRDHVTEVAARTTTIHLAQDYIHVDGIHGFGGKVHVTKNYCMVRNGTFRHGLEILDELDNTDAQMNNGSVHIEGSHTLIENNVIEYGSSNGIALLAHWKGSSDNTIRNNVIRYFNTIGIHSGNIRSNCPRTRIIGNTIHDTGRDGVYVSGGSSEIAYNDIYHCMKINNDGGVFYTVGNQSTKNSKIHHNWCHDSYGPDYADGRAAGIYLDNDSKGYDVHHNVVWNITWTAVQMNWDNWYNNIFNNSFWNVGGAMGNWLNGRELIDNKVYNNYSSSGPWIGNFLEANIVDPDSPFEDVSEPDFTPALGSVIIDKGLNIPGITTQVMGLAPDVGAYEYAISPWRPGVNYEAGGDTLSSLEVRIIHPEEDQVFDYPGEVRVEARELTQEEGVVMTLFLNGLPVGTDSLPPYLWEPADYEQLSALPWGSYELQVLATDLNGYGVGASIRFLVSSASVGDSFRLGNGTGQGGTDDVWTSNMVINKSDLYTNRSDTSLFLRVSDFSFFAQDSADPVTPFVVRVDAEDEFTVLAVGDTRTNLEYVKGENHFAFREEMDTTLLLEPGETIAPGFLDAFPNGTGGGMGPVIPYDEMEPLDKIWYTGSPVSYQSGWVNENEAPHYDTPPRTYYLRNYHYNIGFVIADIIDTHNPLQPAKELSLSVYPNPVSGPTVTVGMRGADLPVSLSVMDLQGRVLFSRSSTGNRIHFSTSEFPAPGTYLVRVGSGGRMAYAKLIIL